MVTKSKYACYQKITLCLMMILLFIGCTNDSRVDGLSKELALAKERITETERKIDFILTETDRKLNAIQEENKREKLKNKLMDGLALLTPGAEGYTTVKHELGILTVKIDNIVPYANGSKVTIRFGNPLYAGLTRVKAKIEYGPVNEDGQPLINLAQSKDVTLGNSLNGGAWTCVDFVLEGVAPEKLGFVLLKEVSHTGIELTECKKH